MPGDRSENEEAVLYQHSERTEWGLAIVAWDRGDRRAYQFQDGKLRVFKKGYYDKFEPVDKPVNQETQLVAKLERKLEVARARKSARVKTHESSGPQAPVSSQITFEQQLELFAHLYPRGFQSDKWLANIRGRGSSRRLKRHREAAIELAQRELSREAMSRYLDEDPAQGVQAIFDVLDATNLISSRHYEDLLEPELEPERQRTLVETVDALLWGQDGEELRFERFVGKLGDLLGKEPSWQLATVLPALVQPERHVCIRPSTFRAQAQWMAPHLAYVKTPNAPLYRRFLDMATAVRDALIEAGREPNDLMDVYDFIWVTLRPAAAPTYKKLAAARRAA